MYLALVELEVFSGLSVFLPLTSTSAPVYPLPPPTTLVGALAYPYLRLSNTQEHIQESEVTYSPAIKLLDNILYASAGALGYIVTRDVERLYQAIYQRRERWSEKYKELWYTIGIRGVVNYLNNKLYILYISNKEDILYYTHGITRIGRKEGHVSVTRVVIKQLDEVIKSTKEGEVFETIFYTPTKLAVCDPTTSITMFMPKLTRTNFTYTLKADLDEYYIPKNIVPARCVLLRDGALVNVDGFEVAIPKFTRGVK